MYKRNIRSRFNYEKMENPEISHKHKNMTIPGESYNLRDLVKKMKLGIMPPVERAAIWQENPEHSDLDLSKVHNYDLFEKQEVIQEQNSLLNRLKQDAADGEANRTPAAVVTEGSEADRRKDGERTEEPLPEAAS